MSEKMEMTLGISMVLAEVTEKLLYSVEDRNGEKVLVDRDIPFRLRYRLNRNRVMFNKDVQLFNKEKLLLLAQYGEPSEDGKNVVIKNEQKLELYKQRIENLIDSKVEHNIMTLEPEDIEMVSDSDIKISPDAMTLFIGYMTNDPELDRDLSSEVIIRKLDTPKVEEKKEEVPAEPVKSEEPSKAEEPVEVKADVEVKAEEPVKAAPKKKAPRKKKTEKAEETPVEKKADGEDTPVKKTTRKKTSRKKKVEDGE